SGPEHLETAFRLVRDSFERSARGLKGRLRVAQRLSYRALERQVVGLGENVKIFVAMHQKIPQGCAVIPFSERSAYYMHGGTIAEPLTGAMNLLQWEAIRALRTAGVQRYDFFGARRDPEKGSKAEGIIKFKERFGGQLISGYMWKFPLR